MAKLYFYYSSMNAGKSTTLLQASHNYHERGMNTLLYTAAIDDRFGVGKISSRIGISHDALLFNHHTDFIDEISKHKAKHKIDCILIDEAQFLNKKQVAALTHIVDNFNIPVLCYGLRLDFQAELFEGSKYLLAWADKLVELKTICECGSKAHFVIRFNEQGQAVIDGDQIEIGGNDRYLSVCRKHYKAKTHKEL